MDVTGDDGNVVRLVLGSCSRFDGPGSNIVPKAGSKIVFKAANTSNGNLLHAASLLN